MKGRNRKKFDIGLIFIALVSLIFLGGIYYIYQQVRIDPVTTRLQQGKPFIVQIMVHEEKELRFTELFFYSPETGRGSLLNIPGNLGVMLPSLRKIGPIGSLYRANAIEKYRDAIENVIESEIPFYWEVSFAQLERFIDLIGGLEVFIPNAIEVNVEGRKIQFPAGNIRLDGAKAIVYLALQNPEESEIDRTIRTQKFLQSLLKKIAESADFLMHPDVLPHIRDNVRTDMETRGLLTFIGEMRKLDAERMVFQRVLGNTRTVEAQDLLFPHFEGQLLRQTLNKMVENLSSPEGARVEDAGITLEILNGTRVPGLARRTREIFQSFGFEVVSYGNAADQNVERTVLIDRRGNRENAMKVGAIIRCTNIITGPSPYGGREDVDITLVLGGNFDGRYCR